MYEMVFFFCYVKINLLETSEIMDMFSCQGIGYETHQFTKKNIPLPHGILYSVAFDEGSQGLKLFVVYIYLNDVD